MRSRFWPRSWAGHMENPSACSRGRGKPRESFRAANDESRRFQRPHYLAGVIISLIFVLIFEPMF